MLRCLALLSGGKGKAFCKMAVSTLTELEVLYEAIAVTSEFVLFQTKLGSAAPWLYQLDLKTWKQMGEPKSLQVTIKPA